VAVGAVRSFEHLDALQRVVFVCASRDVYDAYQAALSAKG